MTGATSGIGREIARQLAVQGVALGIVARDAERGRALQEELRTLGATVELFVADLLQQSEIHRLADEVSDRFASLDALVNNAGGVFPDFARTADGFERTFALNHFAYFVLTLRLLPLLRANTPARIVNVASTAHRSARLDLGMLTGDERRPFRRLAVYGSSKLANVLFTYELARRLAGTGVVANCLHPGVVRTGFGRGGGWVFHLGFTIASPFFRSAQRGADTAVWLATAPEAAAANGQYFEDRRARPSSALSHDRALADSLWRESERLARLAHPFP